LKKLHNGSFHYGSKWHVGDVIGFSIDMRSEGATVMSISVNGDFTTPNGISFDNIEAPYLTPAFPASSGQYRVNFGDRPFTYAPIDEHYIFVHFTNRKSKSSSTVSTLFFSAPPSVFLSSSILSISAA
jgi:hypothetical protein